MSFSVEGDSTSSWNGLPSVSNPYYPKGDVNSEDKMWWSVLKKLSGMSICRINAIGGSTVTKVNDSNTEMSNPARYLDLKSNGTEGDAPDVIILKGSINDWNSTVEMGTYEDDYLAVTDKFIPAYRGLLYHLQETYTNSMIFCCTPIKSFRDVTNYYPPTKNGLELTMFVDAIKKCASLHGVRCIDLYNNININQLNVDYKLYDKTLHPAAITMKEIGTYIFNSILQSY